MIVMKVLGTASGAPTPFEGQYVRTYDPDGHDGRGDVQFTRDPARALQFATKEAAFAAWRQVSKVQPKRADGKPNAPLTAYHVEIGEA